MEKIKVLLVDDDLDFGNTAVLLLKKAGYEVYFQNTLFGVESLIMKLSPNLIILDVMIGEENKSTTSVLPQKTSLSCVYLRYMIQNSKLRLPIMVQ